ncbi:MAG: hypothetical protein ACREIU_02180, partial [Planctomycetota bacterium]
LEARGWSPELCIGSSAGGINLLRATVGGADAAVEVLGVEDGSCHPVPPLPRARGCGRGRACSAGRGRRKGSPR